MSGEKLRLIIGLGQKGEYIIHGDSLEEISGKYKSFQEEMAVPEKSTDENKEGEHPVSDREIEQDAQEEESVEAPGSSGEVE